MSREARGTSAARYRALIEAAGRKPHSSGAATDADGSASHVSSIFGSHTFNRAAMQRYLPADVFQKLQDVIHSGSKLDDGIARTVAHGMKEWAMSLGATHFCHWFQPQTGLTAEKHDAFLTFDGQGWPIERFSAGQLVQSEPDASSFPSGGMRSTAQARGYTAWDASSPAFVMDGPGGSTLYIPSVFIGYHGESLDEKAPLLRSMDALSRQAVRVLKLLGQGDAQRVVPTAGPEQEYFLVDRALAMLRPDLVLTGRTLLGARPAKGQELEDHYFGAIKPRIQAFMHDAEEELYRLGIPAKTRHNEVAPSQYELAPIFEEANVAADHNQLLMEVMRRVARRHDLALLLHEKPFAGINGSGKHVNWSLSDDAGHNLLEPGTTPQSNLQFLVFLMAVLKGVHKRAGLLRASVASSGNDHRLGANEAPPAIISVFLGEQLDRILDDLESGPRKGKASREPARKRVLSLGLSALPAVSRDDTDRNRTSPFAFTGNKFEFRAVGSSFSIAAPLCFLNAAVAEALDALGTAIEAKAKEQPLEDAVMDVVREAIVETKAVRYEGDNYAPEWVIEAERRGLPHLKTSPEALAVLNRDGEKKFLARYGVLTTAESESRYHVKLERYIKDLEIESEALADLARTMVLPAAYRFQAELGRGLAGLKDLPSAGEAQDQALLHAQRNACDLAGRTGTLTQRLEALEEALREAARIGDLARRAGHFARRVVPALAAIRESADGLERLLPDDLWSLPKYRELLFIH